MTGPSAISPGLSSSSHPVSPVSVAGGTFLVVRLDHANTFSVPASPAVDSPIVREIRKTQDFEGVITWVIGLDTQRPFGVSTDPGGHVTIDIEV